MLDENILKYIIQWNRDIMFLSNPNMFLESPHYLFIKNNYDKNVVLQHLIFCIDKYPNMIIEALHDITDEISFNNDGDIYLIIKKWKDWFDKQQGT